jgi:hypothetical protein
MSVKEDATLIHRMTMLPLDKHRHDGKNECPLCSLCAALSRLEKMARLGEKYLALCNDKNEWNDMSDAQKRIAQEHLKQQEKP